MLRRLCCRRLRHALALERPLMLDLYEALSPDIASEGTFALSRSR